MKSVGRTQRRALPLSQSEKIILFNILFSRVGVELTTCRVYARSCHNERFCISKKLLAKRLLRSSNLKNRNLQTPYYKPVCILCISLRLVLIALYSCSLNDSLYDS